MTSAPQPANPLPASSQQSSTPHQSPAHLSMQAASPQNKRDLKSWWKGFKLPSKHHDHHDSRQQGIFGVPLRQSITYANVAISLVDEQGKSYIYGYVPIVVAKCGVFLKEKATEIEGIFRLSGSEKRIKELKTIFDSPERYGKGLVWDGYTVHDAANVLRRYLNDLPEPVVPLDLYEKFREPLRGATKQGLGDAEGPQFVDNFDMDGAILKYQQLITELPPLNRQLLLYILDLLAVFSAKSDINRMNSQNLAAIFQPGMLSHPAHAMAPDEYRLNQCVIIFLIENQDHFLIGMQGTAADETTVREVQRGGTPAINAPSTPSKSSGVARSASNASAGAESVAKEGKIRRNKSTSSRHSRQSTGAPSPGSPAIATTPTSGLARSNTVPSKKSPALQSGRFARGDSSTPVAPLTPVTPSTTAFSHPPPVVEEVPSPEEAASPPSLHVAAAGPAHLNPAQEPAPSHRQDSLLEPGAEVSTPRREIPHLFQRSPTGESDRRQPNKLRKKKLPGSANPSAQSSTVSLSHSAAGASPSVEISNPMEFPAPSALATHPELPHQSSSTETPSEPTPRASQVPSSNTLHPEAAEHALRSKRSPPTSLHSSFNEGSDIDQVDEPPASAEAQEKEKEKKRRWRLSRPKKDDNAPPPLPPISSPKKEVGVYAHAGLSTSSIGSSGNKPRRSFTGESSEPTLTSPESATLGDAAGKERDDRKGLLGFIKDRYHKSKENAEQRRNKSPPADRSTLNIGNSFPIRGKSLDIKRTTDEDRPDQTPQEPKTPR